MNMIKVCNYKKLAMLKYFVIFLIVILGSLIFIGRALAAGPCAAENIRWASSSNRIYVTGNVECTLTDIKALGSKSIPLELVDPTEKVWFLGANIFIQNGAKLVIHGVSTGGDVNELRLKSNNTASTNNFVKILANWGTIDIDGAKVTSWDEGVGEPDTEYTSYKRAYIHVRSYLDTDGITTRESRMNIKNSDLGYLGYAGSEAYGLTWKVLGRESIGPGVFDVVGVYGDVVNNKIHNNYFGAYTYGAEAMTFLNNEVYNNIQYGIDPHDDSDYLLIDSNYVHNNGNHGIICSQRCNNLTIANNNSSNNGGNGIMLHRNTNDSLVKDNELYDNVDSGIAIFDSHRNQIFGNTARYNAKGIRFSVGSSNNIIENNIFSENSKYGMYFYKGSDIPTTGDGRVKSNTFKNNVVNTNISVAVKMSQADSNVFENNGFTGNGSYVVYLEDSNNNTFEKSNMIGNRFNYYYARLKSVNTIRDSDIFSVKIGDAVSSMTITDSANAILDNSKNLPINTYPTYSLVVLNQANINTSIVSFNRLDFTATPATDNLTIDPVTWNTDGDFYKKWTAKNDIVSPISVSYSVGNLAVGMNYDVVVDGALWSTFTADSSGEINFIYEGIFQNAKTFEVKKSL